MLRFENISQRYLKIIMSALPIRKMRYWSNSRDGLKANMNLLFQKKKVRFKSLNDINFHSSAEVSCIHFY